MFCKALWTRKELKKRAGRRKKTKFLSLPKLNLSGNLDRFFINLASVGNLENFENQFSIPLPVINDYTTFFIDVFLSIFAPPCNILFISIEPRFRDVDKYQSWWWVTYKLCKGRFFLSSNQTDQPGWNSNELEWNHPCIDFIVKKASKKLYSLRILCRAGVAQDNILKVYLSTVRHVLACCLCMASFTVLYHPLQFLLPRPLFNRPEYNLRKSANRFYLFIESVKEGRKLSFYISIFWLVWLIFIVVQCNLTR